MTDASKPETRAGFAAIVGRPNVGKSTLLNTLLGAKLAIVSPRPQTTRNRILGVHTADAHQTIFVDTPGIHRGGGDLNRFMVREALASLDGVDCVILVTETLPRELRDAATAQPSALLHAEDRFVLEQVLGHASTAAELPSPLTAAGPAAPSAKLVIALNKIDLLRDRRSLLPLLAAWNEVGFTRLVPISARTGNGVDRLLGEVHSLLPAGPHLYPEDMLTDRAERFLAAELIREQVFMRCRQELPYAVAVEVDAFRERPERQDVTIEARVHVERESQKGILVGKGARMIKSIGTAARDEIARLLGCTVHLKLTVCVAQEWTRRPSARRRFGYE